MTMEYSVPAFPAFDRFVAIDWSGAARNYDGIAIASCKNGTGPPRLEPAPRARWRRTDVAEWLKNILDLPERVLIGFDFAFGFPFERNLGYLGGHARGIKDIFSLWSFIESRSCADPDFACGRFIADADYAHLFWTAGTRPLNWIERKRRTEFACAEATKTRPDTVYKLLHSKQVGKASITGIRVLHHVRSAKGARAAVWPFDAIRRSAFVEIYPTLFRKIATGSTAKLRSLSSLNAALAVLKSKPVRKRSRVEFSDHETDALISAAGMRMIARDSAVWRVTELNSPQVRREGWIFGTVAT